MSRARLFAAFLHASLLPATILLPAPPASGKPAGEWKVESSDSRGLVLAWENASLGRAGESDPRSVPVGVPAGSRPTGRLEVLEEKDPGPSAFGASSRALSPAGSPGGNRGFALTVSPPGRYRDLEVSAVTLNPAREGRVASKARIRIEFNPPAGDRSVPSVFAQAPESPPERHLQTWILNYAQSRGFRNTPARPLAKTGAASKAAAGPSRGAALPKVRLVVQTAGENIQVLDFKTLREAGAPLDRIDPRFMRLYHDGVEVPMYVSGGDDGRWNAQDYIEFIGKAPSGTHSHLSQFVSTATFILAWEGGRLGLRAPAVPVSSRGQNALSSGADAVREAPPFRASVHLEKDEEILRIGSTAAEEVVDLGARVENSELTDFWMWVRQGTQKDALAVEFDLAYDPVPQGEGAALKVPPLVVKVNLKGITNNPKANPDHHVKFLLNGKDISLVDGVSQDAVWEGQEAYTWTSRPLNPGVLRAGRNELVIQKVNDLKTNDQAPVEVQDAYLNWFELEFPSGYATRADHLRFSNAFEDSLGARLFTLKGFSRGETSVWDLKGRKLTGYRVARSGDAYEIGFVDSLAGPARYIACTLDKREVPRVRLDTLEELVSPAEGADYLVVTARELLGPALDSLLDHRRRQGLRCRAVLASHVYQAFGDGSMDPAAIRAFVEHAYRNWPRPAPAYLLLLGETSLWYEKKYNPSHPTLVPTQLVNIHGWGVAANDDYFAKVSGEDEIPDLFVGRIPVADAGDLSKVVRKTLALETRRPAGHWANKALLVSGFEETFSLHNGTLQSLAVSRDAQVSRLDLFPKSPHYRNAAQRAGFFDQLDSAFSLVSFVGHGGGAVWSDAGVLTLTHLDERRLRGEYPIPLVSSITCLTGYFEDVNARSLGEEMLRLDKGGAAAFYGAAGYISNLAGEALSYEVLNAATGGAATAGAVIHQAETMVQLRTAGAFSPVLSEFNLLGDPALRLAPTSAQGSLDLSPRALSGAGAGSMEIKGRALAPDQAEGVLTLYLGDSAVGASPATVAGGTFAAQRNLEDLSGPGLVPDGKAVFHYWSGKESRVAAAPFSTLDWLIDSVRLDPGRAAPGDSAVIRLRLGTAYGKIAVDGGIAYYSVGGGDPPPFPEDNQIALRVGPVDGPDHRLESSARIAVPLPGAVRDKAMLHLAFRIRVRVLDADGNTLKTIPNLSSRTYSLPLSDLGRLAFADPAFRIPIQETLGVWAVVKNSGLGAAAGFSVMLAKDADGASPSEEALSYSGTLGPGRIDSIFFPLADSLVGGRRLRATLQPSREGELAGQGTVKDTVLRISTRRLAAATDTLRLDSATSVSPAPGTGTRRVFAEKAWVAALPPHLSPVSGGLPLEAWRVRSPAMEAGSLILTRTDSGSGLGKPAASAASPADPGAGRPYWHFQAQGGPWFKLDTASAGFPWTARAQGEGLYVPLHNRDVSPPLVQFSSRGQALLEDDYVPQSTPIDVVIRDAEGVDMLVHPPTLASGRQSMDSSNLAAETSSAASALVRFNFIPRHAAAQDSLEVVAADVSGNVTRKSLAYRLGDDLTIRNLGSYPNPFADTAVFVYSLTDFCDRVRLRIYSRAGRLVRTLEERNVVGYREVVWDGRADGGAAIGNGLYFLKVSAEAGGQEVSKVFKLFKKRRK